MENDRRSPIVDARGKVHVHIERQTRGYKREDPATKHEKALPPKVFRHRLRMAKLPRELARAHLLCGALFYGMRSCEFLGVGNRERKTRPIRVRDIVFRRGERIISHESPELLLSDDVSIDFGEQKSELKDETITQDATSDPELNPVTHWAFTVRRLRSYPGFKDTWEVFTFYDGQNFTKISATEMLADIRAAVAFIGKDVLGFGPEDVGNHSVRASLAMMMYLAKEPVYTIMLVGRWSSDAFLSYIEKQIKEFTRGVSSRMLERDVFYNVPLASDSAESNSANRHGRSHHRRALLKNIYGRQGSLRHQLQPRY